MACGSLAVGGAMALCPPNTVFARQIIDGEAVERALEEERPLALTDFDLYFDYLDGMATLIYVRRPCDASDRGREFFVHVYPFDANVLADQEHSADRREFEFRFHNADFALIGDDTRCVVAQRVPDIDARVIETGQFNDLKDIIWSVRIEFSETGEPSAATIGPAAERSAQPEHPDVIYSHLYAFDVQLSRMRDPLTRGGAIEPLGNDLLVAFPWGELALVRDNGAVEPLGRSIPMNNSGLEKWAIRSLDLDLEDKGWTANTWPFRVTDILVKQVGPGRWELFATHHYFAGDCIRFRLSATTIERRTGEWVDTFAVSRAWRTVFDAEPCLKFPRSGAQAGGKMLTDGPHRLLIVIGDHLHDGWPRDETVAYPVLPQDPDSPFGKLVSIDIASGRAEILALGLRNPQGLARDRDGRLWAAEHGPKGGDELNILEEGRNYGWPSVTYGLTYDHTVPQGVDATEVGFHDGFVRPAYSWVPSAAVSAVAVNDRTSLPLWRDDILVAALGGSLFRIRRTGNRVIYAEEIHLNLPGQRIRDIVTMPDGRIALLVGGFSVAFLSLSRKHCGENADEVYPPDHVYMLQCSDPSVAAHSRALPTVEGSVQPAGRVDSSGDRTAVSDGEALFASRCARCHSVRTPRHGSGPHLAGVVGRRAGEVSGYNFSAAFNTLAQIWTPESLVRFLSDPEEFAPGNRMPDTGVSQAQARMIADYLENVQ